MLVGDLGELLRAAQRRAQARAASGSGTFGLSDRRRFSCLPAFGRPQGSASSTLRAVVDCHARDTGTMRRELTASIGGARIDAPAGATESLLLAADRALYAAKRAGRNRVRLGSSHADLYDEIEAWLVPWKTTKPAGRTVGRSSSLPYITGIITPSSFPRFVISLPPRSLRREPS